MKTVKILLMAVITAATVYSCSSERDEEVQSNPAQPKLDLKKLKTSNNQGETSKLGDSVLIEPHKLPTDPVDPTNPTDPNEGDPKDVPPRK